MARRGPPPTPPGHVTRLWPVRARPGEHLNAPGHEHVYALGDIADLADAKMATRAQTQALVVAENLRAQLKGELPDAVYQPAPVRRIFLPLGTRGGVGQLPMPDGTPAQATLLPGDLVLTGSPAGNGLAHGRLLRPGDLLESAIAGLGAQVNHCVAEA
jgi:Fumarylacetoacetate (FAA) hydrolase family